MPEVMMIEEVQQNALLVDDLWLCWSNHGILDWDHEEVESRGRQGHGDDEEDDAREGWSLSSNVFHDDIEIEVKTKIPYDDVEKNG